MNPFTLVRLPTLDAAGSHVAAEPSQRTFRAGGIDLIDRMKEGLDSPEQLVELAAIADEHGALMRGISTTDDGGWRIGALVTLAQLAGFADLPSAYGALRDAAGNAATPSIRNGATAGGNLLQRPRCWYYRHADLQCLKKGGYECFAATGDNRYNAILGGGPSYIVHPSSLGSALVALDASVTVGGPDGLRTLPAEQLFAPPTVDPTREHTLADGEVLLSIDLPPALAGQRSDYHFAKEKQSQDWPLAEASVRCTIEGGALKNVRVALGHVAPVPWRSKEAEAVLEGAKPSADLCAKAAEAALSVAKPLEGNAYKVPLAQGVLRYALHFASSTALPA
jgi:xanthine dehydrogenase YagS FAD-binding subunit